MELFPKYEIFLLKISKSEFFSNFFLYRWRGKIERSKFFSAIFNRVYVFSFLIQFSSTRTKKNLIVSSKKLLVPISSTSNKFVNKKFTFLQLFSGMKISVFFFSLYICIGIKSSWDWVYCKKKFGPTNIFNDKKFNRRKWLEKILKFSHQRRKNGG